MADEPLSVSPQDLRATSGHLGDVSTRMSNVLKNLTHSLDGEGSPWGNDDTGNQFSQGDSGYLAQYAWVKSAIGDKTDLLNGYSTNLRNTADGMEQQDQS